MVHARLAFVVAALSTLAACNSKTEKLEALLDDYAEERLSLRDLLCTCPSALGFTTSEECETGLGEIDGEAKQCIVDAFEGRESLGEDYFECLLPLQVEYSDCLHAAFTCGDDWFVPCEETFDMQVLETCTMLPTDVSVAYSDCLSG
jgi:hypothetical protein